MRHSGNSHPRRGPTVVSGRLAGTVFFATTTVLAPVVLGPDRRRHSVGRAIRSLAIRERLGGIEGIGEGDGHLRVTRSPRMCPDDSDQAREPASVLRLAVGGEGGAGGRGVVISHPASMSRRRSFRNYDWSNMLAARGPTAARPGSRIPVQASARSSSPRPGATRTSWNGCPASFAASLVQHTVPSCIGMTLACASVRGLDAGGDQRGPVRKGDGSHVLRSVLVRVGSVSAAWEALEDGRVHASHGHRGPIAGTAMGGLHRMHGCMRWHVSQCVVRAVPHRPPQRSMPFAVPRSPARPREAPCNSWWPQPLGPWDLDAGVVGVRAPAPMTCRDELMAAWRFERGRRGRLAQREQVRRPQDLRRAVVGRGEPVDGRRNRRTVAATCTNSALACARSSRRSELRSPPPRGRAG